MARQAHRGTWALLVVLTAIIVPFSRGYADEPRSYSISAQPLGAALREFARQTDREILFSSDLVKGKMTRGVQGASSARAALVQLLAGTGLTSSTLPTGQILISIADGKEASAGAHPQDAPMGALNENPARQPTSAQSPLSAGLQEIVVTAQKYRQRALDVPISMTVIGGAELKRLQITNLEELQYFVPGMFVDNDGPALRITIGGISNVFGQAALVGTYLDEADVTSQGAFGLDLNTYDLARVEVLKGPQGTLYGEGSLGGTIRYITHKPVLNEVQMGVDVTGLFDQYGAPESRVEAVVNAPIVEDVLGLRIAADLDQGGGWVDQPAAGRSNVNSRNLADARIEGRWQPRDDFTIDAMEVIHRETSGPHTLENPPGIYTQVFNLTSTPSLVDDYNISNVTARFSPGAVTVVDSASYFTHYNNERNFGGNLVLLPPPSPMFEDYWPSAPNIDESLSDELRLAGAGSGRWRWTIGGFFKRIDNYSPNFLFYFGLQGPPGTPLPAPSSVFDDIYSKSVSVFGDTSYRVLDDLVVGLGARYFKDDENALLLEDNAREKARFTSADPRLYIRYGISQNANVYASAAKGFRSGGFNGEGFPQYQPEHVWTYDLGAKMMLLDRRLTVNSDVFVSNYGAYQIVGVPPQPAIPQDVTHNAGDVRVKGIEGDIAWTPGGRWRLALSGDYVNGRFVAVAVEQPSYQVGDPVDDVPRYQLTTSAERAFQWLGRPGSVSVDYAQRARASFRNRYVLGSTASPTPWYYGQSDYMYLLGFRAGIDWTSNLHLGFFVQNLLNDRGYTGSDSLEGYTPREQPRTFGVNFSARVQ